MATDLELWEAWTAGDEGAANLLVERCFLGVHRFFQSKLPEHADELTQRTFLACIEQRDAFRAQSSFRAFLFGIARKQLLRHLEGREGRAFDAAVSMHDLDPSPSRVVAAQEQQEVLLAALRRVPLDFQIVLELFYWEDLRLVEIAEALEIALGTVKSRLSRGKRLLREELERLGAHTTDLEGDTRRLAGVLTTTRG